VISCASDIAAQRAAPTGNVISVIRQARGLAVGEASSACHAESSDTSGVFDEDSVVVW
jgi:hypothetical protein